ncbi:MAG: clan AA aspartic protease [Cyanobacteria bacterium P01_D01_bin.44]
MVSLQSPTDRQDAMGAVEVKVRLTNSVDEELVKRGLLNPNLLRHCEVAAFVDTGVDTGLVRTVLSSAIVEKLGLTIRAQQRAQYADGREEMVGVTGPVIIEVDGRETIEAALVTGDSVLIGQTVLETLDLLVDCKNQWLMPNPEHPEEPILRV